MSIPDSGSRGRDGAAGEQPPVDEPDQKQQKLLDTITFIVLLGAGGVTTVMSARGAHAMLAELWIAIPFALVVHVVLGVALWLLPSVSLPRKLVLVAMWFVAVIFSVGSAYFGVHRSNSAERVAELKDSTALYVATVGTNLQQLADNARLAEDEAKKEDQRGIYSQGRAGRGPVYRDLAQVATKARAASDAADGARKVISEAVQELKRTGLTTEDVRGIYYDVLARAGSYAKDVPAPDFSVDQRSFVAVVSGALSIALGAKENVSPTERSRVRQSLISASIMEVLAALCAVFRLLARRRRACPDDRTLATVAGGLIAGVVHFPRAVRLSVAARGKHLEHLADRCRREQSRAELNYRKAMQGDPKETWKRMLHTQAAAMNKRCICRIASQLLELTRKDRQLGYRNVALFAPGQLEQWPIVLQGARATGVVEVDPATQRLAPGLLWDDWILFLVDCCPTAAQRRRKGQSKPGKPDLHVIDGGRRK